jgi:hypothetical protein
MIGAFRKEAVRRGLLPKATPLTPKTASALVRDMPHPSTGCTCIQR